MSHQRWMMFVDGENLTIRAQEVAKQQGVDLGDTSQFCVYCQNVYFWPAGHTPWAKHNYHPWTSRAAVADFAERCYYYTCAPGDEDQINKVHDALQAQGFTPVVLHKPKGDKRAKGVDISLAKDMLVHAFTSTSTRSRMLGCSGL
jgi:hypothetical protein